MVLDEPTNRLDQSVLKTYPGILLLVTQDRRMLEAVQANRYLDVDRGQATDR